MRTFGQKFEDMEEAFDYIAYALNEIDPAQLDDEAKEFLVDSLVIAEAYRDALNNVRSWDEARHAYTRQVRGWE